MRSTVPPQTPQVRALIDADAAWARRDVEGNLDAAIDAWRGLMVASPGDPGLLARLARAEWTRGQLDAADAIPHFETGRDDATRCLMGWSGFAAILDANGYRVTPEAVEVLPAGAAPCLLWAAIDGLALADIRGPGAALELETDTLYLDRLATLEEPVAPGFLAWARAALLVLEARPDSPPAEARSLFDQAITEAPGVLLFRVTFAEAFPDVRNRAYERYAPPVPDPWALENAVWAARRE